MELVPRRSSLVGQTVTILRDGLKAGLWKEFLPGELALCERMQVSRVTLRAALDQLQREKWLQGGQGRRRRIVAKHASRVSSPSDLVILLSPVPPQDMSSSAIFWVDALRDHLTEAGYRLEIYAKQACYSRRPNRALESLLHASRAAGWVLYLSTQPLQRWFSERGLPCVISGSRHPGVELSSVDIDYAATCRHAAGVLLSHGRKRIALLIPRSEQAGNLESERGFTEAGAKLAGQGVSAVVKHHDGSVRQICRALDELLRGPQPITGILIAKPAYVVTTVSHLLRRGTRLPQDVSLISRDDDPLLEHLVPNVARYHTDPVLFARKISRPVMDLVCDGVRPRHDCRLMPAFVRGETVG